MKTKASSGNQSQGLLRILMFQGTLCTAAI